MGALTRSCLPTSPAHHKPQWEVGLRWRTLDIDAQRGKVAAGGIEHADSVVVGIGHVEFTTGRVLLLNDPYAGGIHGPDWTLIAPVCY